MGAAKYTCGPNGAKLNYREAKERLAVALELAKSEKESELQKMAIGQGAEIITLGPTIALAYLSMLQDCQIHCRNEGAEVKCLGGLHVIGTALHESRRIDNQVWFHMKCTKGFGDCNDSLHTKLLEFHLNFCNVFLVRSCCNEDLFWGNSLICSRVILIWSCGH